VCTAEGERGRGSQMKREFLVREKREEKKYLGLFGCFTK
jgi:hypothetical protein